MAKRIVVLLGCVGALAFLGLAPVRAWPSSWLRLPAAFLYGLASNTHDLITYPLLRRRAEESRRVVALLTQQLAEVRDLAEENVRLRRLAGFLADASFQAVPARVIAHDPLQWNRLFYLNQGTDAGIQTGIAVVTADGVVGRVRHARKDFSIVTALSDPEFRVGALIERTRLQGLLVGTPQGQCLLTFLPPESDVASGDVVVTAGVGGPVPRGLKIGVVRGVRADPGGLSKTAVIAPSADAGRTEEVLCIKPDLKGVTSDR